jgi:hypothetical protein
MDCVKDHRSNRTTDAVTDLRESQKSYWRHKCAACAYEKGFEDGKAEAERVHKRANPAN